MNKIGIDVLLRMNTKPRVDTIAKIDKVVQTLEGREWVNITDVAKRIQLSLAYTHAIIRNLESAGVVKTKKLGRNRMVKLANIGLKEV